MGRRLLPARSTSRAAVVGSCSSAVPTWTAVAPAARKARASSAVAIPPQPTICASGRRRRTSATQRSASGRIAGPLSPPGRPSGIAAGSALPTTTAAAPASRTVRALSRPGRRRSAAWPAPACRAGRSRRTAETTPGRVERLADVEDAAAAASGAERLTSIPATPGERPSRRASSAYSPSDARRSSTKTRTPCCTSQGSSMARNWSMPGFCRPTAFTRPEGSPGSAAARPPGRA